MFDQTRARSSAQRQGDLFQSRTLPPGTARIPRSRFRQPFGEDLLSALVVVAEEPAYPQLDPNRNSLPGKIAQSPLVPAMHAAGGSPARRTDALLPRRPQPHDEPAPPLSSEFLQNDFPSIGNQRPLSHGRCGESPGLGSKLSLITRRKSTSYGSPNWRKNQISTGVDIWVD